MSKNVHELKIELTETRNQISALSKKEKNAYKISALYAPGAQKEDVLKFQSYALEVANVRKKIAMLTEIESGLIKSISDADNAAISTTGESIPCMTEDQIAEAVKSLTLEHEVDTLLKQDDDIDEKLDELESRFEKLKRK